MPTPYHAGAVPDLLGVLETTSSEAPWRKEWVCAGMQLIGVIVQGLIVFKFQTLIPHCSHLTRNIPIHHWLNWILSPRSFDFGFSFFKADLEEDLHGGWDPRDILIGLESGGVRRGLGVLKTSSSGKTKTITWKVMSYQTLWRLGILKVMSTRIHGLRRHQPQMGAGMLLSLWLTTWIAPWQMKWPDGIKEVIQNVPLPGTFINNCLYNCLMFCWKK